MTDATEIPERRERDGHPPPDIDAAPLDDHLRAALEDIDCDRLRRLHTFEIRIALAGLAAILASVVALLAYLGVLGAGLDRMHFGLYFLAPVLTVVALAHWVDEPRRDYVSDYKARVMPKIAGTLGDFDYFEHGWIDPDRIAGSMLIPAHDHYHSEDLFRGTYRGIDVELAEVRLKKIQHGPKQESVTVFRGVFVVMSMDKTFAGRTVVRRDAGTVYNWLSAKVGGLERVVLEDPKFEDQFEVHASDQVDARSVLTPAVMERLSALADGLGEGWLQAAFYERQLFIMVPVTKNLFEPPSVFDSVLRDSGLSRIARELGDVLSIVDVLSFEERTGL